MVGGVWTGITGMGMGCMGFVGGFVFREVSL